MKHLIWLASYPKSGNTWLRILLDSILQCKGEPININQINTACSQVGSRRYFDEFLEFDSGELTLSETSFYKRKYYMQYGLKLTEDVFVKTHETNVIVNDKVRLIPESVTKLCIYIVRNPLDIVGSISNHFNVDMDRAITIMSDSSFTSFRPKEGITSNIPEMVGDWSSHVDSWLSSKGMELILVKYEDLLNKPIDALNKIMVALNYSVDYDVLVRAVANNNFQKLANQELNNGFREKMIESKLFFRRGKSDLWKKELTHGQIKFVMESHHKVMENLGYTN